MRRVSLMASLAPGEFRRALFEKGPAALRETLDPRTGGKALGLAPQLRVEGIAEGRLEQRLGPAISMRRSRREPRRQCGSLGGECVGRDDAVDDTQLPCSHCVETIAEKHHPPPPLNPH